MEVSGELLNLLPHVITAAGVYAAIRGDLSQLNARMVNVEERAKAAHERIDNLAERIDLNMARIIDEVRQSGTRS